MCGLVARAAFAGLCADQFHLRSNQLFPGLHQFTFDALAIATLVHQRALQLLQRLHTFQHHVVALGHWREPRFVHAVTQAGGDGGEEQVPVFGQDVGGGALAADPGHRWQ